MSDRVTYEQSGWHFTCAPSTIGRPGHEYLAMAKREPFVNFHPIYEPGELWFGYGPTAAGALSDLEKEMDAFGAHWGRPS